jgi:hypothetical protein
MITTTSFSYDYSYYTDSAIKQQIYYLLKEKNNENVLQNRGCSCSK